jgi:RNA polymerase sigma factor (sigma-70 family)
MTTGAVTVYIVDDDAGVLQALSRLVSAAGYRVTACPSPAAFLEQHDHGEPGCVVLDLSMPGFNGLEVQTALASGGDRSIVFITGHGDVPSSVKAMKGGAVDFLTKPFDEADLLRAVQSAIDRDLRLRAARAQRADVERLLETLTPREREVLMHVIAGRINKQIASDLGTVEKTIKVHRARIMAKLKVGSVAELTRLCERAGIGHA